MSRGPDMQSGQPEGHIAEDEPHDPPPPPSTMRYARKTLTTMQAFVGSIYVHVVLVCFPLLYLRSMEDNTDLFSSRFRGLGGRSRIVGGGWANARTSSSRCQWTSFLDGVIHKGYATLAIAGSCLGFGGYVRQQSYEPMPMTLGLVLMIFSGDALLNTLAVLGYIHLVKTNVIAMRAQMNRLSHRALIRAAKLFAVPIAASLWCLAVTVVAAGFYFAQSGAPAMQVPPAYIHGSIARRSRDKLDHKADHDRALSYHEPVSIADHSLPTAGRVVVGVLTGLAVVRFFYVLYCLVRLHKSRGIGRHNRGDIESADMTNNLCAEGLSGIPLRRQAHADTDDVKKGPSEASSVAWTEGMMTGEPEEMAPIRVGDHSSADDSCDPQANATKLNRRSKRAKKQSSGSNGTVAGAWVRPVKSGKTRSSLHRDSKDKGNLDSAEVSGSSSSSAWTTESDSPATIAEEIGTATSILVTS